MENEINYGALGARIREARLRKHISQEKLSDMVNVSVRYMSNIELAKSKIGLQTLNAVANALDTTIDALLYDSSPLLVSKYDTEAKEVLSDCTAEEKQFLIDLMKHAKEDLRNNIQNK